MNRLCRTVGSSQTRVRRLCSPIEVFLTLVVIAAANVGVGVMAVWGDGATGELRATPVSAKGAEPTLAPRTPVDDTLPVWSTDGTKTGFAPLVPSTEYSARGRHPATCVIPPNAP